MARVTPLRTFFFGAGFPPAVFAASAMVSLLPSSARIVRSYGRPRAGVGVDLVSVAVGPPSEGSAPRNGAVKHWRGGRWSRLLRRLLAEFLHALLPGNRLARALAGPGVGAGALAADRQRATVADAAVAADVAQ